MNLVRTRNLLRYFTSLLYLLQDFTCFITWDVFFLVPHSFVRTSGADPTVYDGIPTLSIHGAAVRYSDSLTMPTQILSLSLRF